MHLTQEMIAEGWSDYSRDMLEQFTFICFNCGERFEKVEGSQDENGEWWCSDCIEDSKQG